MNRGRAGLRLGVGVTIALMVGTARADSVCESNLMIVLDRSCSMQQKPSVDGGSTMTKWEIAGKAITSLTTKYKGMLRFGLIMFPDQVGQACLQDGNIYVNVGTGTEAAVVAAVTGTMPTGPCETPIDTAIGQISKDPAFGPIPDPSGRRSFAVLITDGEQSGGCGGTARDAVTVMDLMKLYQQGYDTYVVGFGGAANPVSLSKFAVAGGLPQMGATQFIKANDEAALESALSAIANVAAGAEITGCPGPPCPDHRCLLTGLVCTGGYCQAPPLGGVDSAAGLPGDLGAGGHGRNGVGGCSCHVVGNAAPPDLLVPLLLAFVVLHARRSLRARL
jgi:von Willebrand factor type A domain-containing protein